MGHGDSRLTTTHRTSREDTGYITIAFDAYQLVSYTFSQSTWSAGVGPTTPDDGDRFFFVDTSGVIRFAEGVLAAVASPPIEP